MGLAAMINPNLSLAASAVATAYYLGDSAWRLWRHKPTTFPSLFGETLFALVIVFGMFVGLQAGAVKVSVIAAFIAATILRFVARHRFATS